MSRDLSQQIPSDLQVDQLSTSLAGEQADVAVCGSIAAVTSVKFVRSLRRLGCDVFPSLTPGGSQFITPLALGWASGGKSVVCNFEAANSHISERNIFIAYGASADFLGKLTHGICDTPSLALATSALARKEKHVFAIPAMHESLWSSPAVQENIDILKKRGVQIIDPVWEEGKHKTQSPNVLADIISHRVNNHRLEHKVLVSFGSTKSYIDDVRYISNYSSGALGSAISEECYRMGFNTCAIGGDASVYPQTYCEFSRFHTNDDLRDALLLKLSGSGEKSLVMAASVGDYLISEKISGKIASESTGTLNLSLKRANKILAEIMSSESAQKIRNAIGFKLYASNAAASDLASTAENYLKKYNLAYLVTNQLSEVSQSRHKADIWHKDPQSNAAKILASVEGKQTLAQILVNLLVESQAG